MTDYTITTDFGAKDSLPSGNAAKVIKGSEFTTEFTNILTAVNSKVDSAGDTFTGAVTFDAAVTLNADVTFDTNTMFVDVSANRVGIGNVAPATALDVTGVITTDGLTSSAGIDVTGTVTASGLTVDTDTLYVDATNDRVGIGTTSPATALDVTGIVTADGLLVDGSGIFQGTSTQIDLIETDVTGNNTRLRQTVGDFFIQTVDNASANPVSRFNLDHATGDIGFYEDTGTTAKFFWDASAESLGIGTSSPAQALHVVGKIRLESDFPTIEFVDTDNNPDFTISGGNGAISFYDETNNLDRLLVNSSGNVGIGTSSPSGKLEVSSADFDTLYLTRSTAGSATILMKNSSNNGGLVQSLGNGGLSFFSTVSDSSSERMRIDSSGNVGIGTSSPTGSYTTALHIHGSSTGASLHLTDPTSGATATDGLEVFQYGTDGYIWERETGNLRFGTSATERMRIDSSGNLLVGTTSTSPSIIGAKVLPIGKLTLVTANSGTQYPVIFGRETTGQVGSITTTASATSYNTSSDGRLKENIQDAEDAGSKIDAIQIRQFDWKADGSHQDYGVIAQELVEVAPEAVSEGETEDDMMSVDYSKLVPTLIKEIQTLRNRVAQLENN